ncbi:hypothetical protein OPV22_020608 [Ensete ventricosum]|uniref:Uncharacterized protein n=1 Tax=Ensete ventricosum TaxID=4639 RepID=A0AAV8PC62_ENSVE|nr:hypothetical protein OPV22_020608 [Ensete ventricosum]
MLVSAATGVSSSPLPLVLSSPASRFSAGGLCLSRRRRTLSRPFCCRRKERKQVKAGLLILEDFCKLRAVSKGEAYLTSQPNRTEPTHAVRSVRFKFKVVGQRRLCTSVTMS